jgi:hypothetical protein
MTPRRVTGRTGLGCAPARVRYFYSTPFAVQSAGRRGEAGWGRWVGCLHMHALSLQYAPVCLSCCASRFEDCYPLDYLVLPTSVTDQHFTRQLTQQPEHHIMDEQKVCGVIVASRLRSLPCTLVGYYGSW